ncbi:hypothetical protein [Ralstonia phage RP13]|nr:hypothetical protein [Ralstonia phage RP13]
MSNAAGVNIVVSHEDTVHKNPQDILQVTPYPDGQATLALSNGTKIVVARKLLRAALDYCDLIDPQE